MIKMIDMPFISDSREMAILEESMKGQITFTLMNDFLAKYSLQKDIYALKGFLSAILEIPLDDITDITICNPIEPSDNVSGKECLLDVKLELNHRNIINIEIQSRFQDFWAERSITYLCRTFDHLLPGQSYNSVKPCIHIGILGCELFKKGDPKYTDDFISEYHLLDIKNHKEYSDKFYIKVLLLSHLENATDEQKNAPNSPYKWARLFTARTWEELKMISKDEPRMHSFIGTIKKLSADEKIAQACEARRRYSNDIATYEEEVMTAKAERDNMIAERDSAIKERDLYKLRIAELEAQLKKQ